MSDSDSDHEAAGLPTDLVGFMFGNIDKYGHLENDVFDEKSKSHLMQLSTLAGIGSFVSQLADTSLNASQSHSINEESKVIASAEAVDYSNINELADDENDKESGRPSAFNRNKTDFGIKKGQTQKHGVEPELILPSIVSHSGLHSSLGRKISTDSEHRSAKHGKHDKKKSAKKKRRKERLLQLRQQTEEDRLFDKKVKVIEEKINRTNMRELFPEFRLNKVLRFLRLFGKRKTSSLPNVWRNCRKRKKKKVKKTDAKSPVKDDPRSLEPWRISSPPPATLEDCLTDDEMAMMKPVRPKKSATHLSNKNQGSTKSRIPEWRYGPAALWYDMLGVPENGEGFDYGFKLKDPEGDAFNGDTAVRSPSFPNPDHFYMVSQVRWEDDIIWNADDVRHKVGKNLQVAQDPDERFKPRVDRAAQAGWVPTSTQRTALPHSGAASRGPLSLSPPGLIRGGTLTSDGDNVNSIFPIDNYELIYGNWEKDIIWDDQNMDHIPSPTVFRFDPNDENIILNLPEEPKTCGNGTPSKDSKKESLKKSKLLLGKSGKDSEKEKDESDSLSKKDPWNLSNDSFYDPKHSATNSLAIGLMSAVLQHSIPAMELLPLFFPTFMNPSRLQNFHRPHLRRYQHGALSKPGPHTVHCVMKYLRKRAKQREQERAASGGGEVFFMRKPEDLSALDGHLILAEYSEEYPPLLSQVGMALKVKNYHKRKPDKDSDSHRYRYGETVYSHSSPFLGTLSPGKALQAFECNMYRSPIYEHRSSATDFLVIRTKHNYFIRHVPYIFTVGQLCPLIEVPGPNSKKSTNHIRDFLQVFIYRMFARSRDNPKKIRMEEIRKAFPNHSESSIRKRLKLCADFHRTGQDSNWWVIKKDFRLPTEDEMRAMVSPEQTCSFYSMAAAEQRLKDAGYGEKTMLYQPEDDNEEEHQLKVDEEVLNAPWNSTRAFISALKGKCLLQVTGAADPTGCGEGFSYVKVPMKPQQSKTESAPAPPKKLVTGTDADLRRLSLSNAKQLLKKFGVPEEEIRKLSRWEVIDVVRTMSTEQARAGEGGMSKFARGTRYSVAEHQERYKEECQRIFDLQNKVLSSREILSTDEDSSSADDSDFEEMGKNIENLLSNKKSSVQMSIEKEEEERKELLKMMSGSSDALSRSGSSLSGKMRKDDDPASASSLSSMVGKCLKIHRKFRNDDGSEYTRIETVRKPEVIEAYVKIRSSKNEDFIRRFMMMDEQHREEMRREKRRIQEQLRRIKRNQEKERMNQDRDRKKEKDRRSKDLKADSLKSSQMKCGACGELGHMRTNRYCPMYNRSIPDRPVALTEEQEEDMEKKLFQDSQHVVKVEGTKITLSKDLIKNVEEVKRKSLVLKFQKPDISSPAPSGPTYQATPTISTVRRKRRYQSSASHCDYLTRIAKKKERRRADPVVTLSSLLENVLNGIRDLPETQPFHCPVNPRLVKDYYKIVEKPMDLQSMRENLRKQNYLSRADFREHIELIITNSRLYNGPDSALTKTASRMLEYTESRFKSMEDKLMRLEKAINPLLDDDDQVAFSFILDNIIVQKMMPVPESWPFHNPVNRKFLPDYYNVIERPMDLGTIRRNVQKHQYRNRGQFMEHVELILSNSIKFNGADSKFTETAWKVVSVCREALEESDQHLTELENDIAAAKKAAEVEAADLIDVGSVTSGLLDDDLVVDEDSNMSINIDDKTGADSDVDIETVHDGEGGAFSSGMIGNGQEGSRLLEDLLMSEGEMSGEEEESEDEGDNPFAHRSDSDASELGRDESSRLSGSYFKSQDTAGFASVTSFLDEALSQVNTEGKVPRSTHKFSRKSDGNTARGSPLSGDSDFSD